MKIAGLSVPVPSASLAEFMDKDLSEFLKPSSSEASELIIPSSVCSPPTLHCLIKILEGKPDEFEPFREDDEGDSNEEMDAQQEVAKRHSIPLRCAVELFKVSQHLGMLRRLWPCLLLYLKPMMTSLAMEEVCMPGCNGR